MMSKLVVLLSFFCAVFLLTTSLPGARGQSTSFDFLLLVQQWGNGFCDTENNDPCAVPGTINWWTLHGLWPNNNDGTYPSNCNDSYPFDPSQVSTLVPQLNLYWTNYLTGTGNSFWSHEWDKHGTCAMVLPPLNSEYNFFANTLKIRGNYHFHLALINAGITPSNSNTYTVGQVTTAITNAVGVQPLVGCGYSDSLGYQVLTEIALCIDKNSLQAITCSDAVYQGGIEKACNGDFYYASS